MSQTSAKKANDIIGLTRLVTMWKALANSNILASNKLTFPSTSKLAFSASGNNPK